MIQARVLGAHDLARALTNLSPTMEEGFRKGLVRACLRLQAYIKRSKLSGDPLRNRTGTLRRSINSVVERDGTQWVGKVGTNVWYGAVHELGGTFNVRAHMRTIKQAWGRSLKEPKQVQVRAHTATFPQRSFLASAYKEQQALLMADIKTELSIAARAVGGR